MQPRVAESLGRWGWWCLQLDCSFGGWQSWPALLDRHPEHEGAYPVRRGPAGGKLVWQSAHSTLKLLRGIERR